MSTQAISTKDTTPPTRSLEEASLAHLPGPSSRTERDGSGALLPEPPMVGSMDIGAEIALLGIVAGRDQEMIQQKTEQTQDSIQDAAEQNEVSEMHREATDIMSNAIAAGVMQMGQGAMQIGSAAALGSAPSGGANANGISSDALGASKLAAQSESTALGGMATLFGAGASLFTAEGQSQRELDEALVTSYKAVADRAGQLSQEASQGQTDARSVISNAIQFYQQYVETKSAIDLLAAGQKG